MIKRKEAFTLAELLVVVVVLGILASVAVPKFTRMLETRKTTEAEEMMAAVRTEQEKRCILGQHYATTQQHLAVLSQAGKSSTYQYNLLSKGIEAQRESGDENKNYSLKMWYRTGEMCCAGAGCKDLNKNYPPCEEPLDECAGDLPFPKGCDGDITDTQSCGCKGGGIRTNTRPCVNGVLGEWSGWSACSIGPCQECTTDTTETQPCGCNGTQSRTHYCKDGEWTGYSAWSACSKNTDSETETRGCGCKSQGSQSFTRTCSNGEWTEWKESSECQNGECCCESSGGPTCGEEEAIKVCGCKGQGEISRSRTCDTSTGEWNAWTDWSECPVQDTSEVCCTDPLYPTWDEEQQDCIGLCPDVSAQVIAACESEVYPGLAGTWNWNTCDCECPEGTQPNAAGNCEPLCDTTGLGACLDPDPDAQAGEIDYENCVCKCPSCTQFEAGYGCKATYDKEEHHWCTQSGNTSTWNDKTCECECPEGQIWNGHECEKENKTCIKSVNIYLGLSKCDAAGLEQNGTRPMNCGSSGSVCCSAQTGSTYLSHFYSANQKGTCGDRPADVSPGSGGFNENVFNQCIMEGYYNLNGNSYNKAPLPADCASSGACDCDLNTIYYKTDSNHWSRGWAGGATGAGYYLYSVKVYRCVKC